MDLVRRSLLLSASERYASLVILFLSTAALARLLTPEQFGVYAVVGAITTVISVSTQEFGGANYIIQKTALADIHVRTAFTITLALSVAMGLALWLAAGALGSAFGVTGVADGVRIAALGFAATPFATIASALLRRELMFGALSIGNLAGNVCNAATSITLALKGYGFLAPIWGQVAGAAAQAICLVTARNALGLFKPSLAGRGDVIHFGLISSGVALINLAYATAPNFFLARMGFDAVGLYSRAMTITQLFDKLVIQALGPVVLPAFASQSRAGAEIGPLYLRALSLLAALQWPFLLSVALLAEPIITLWLGPSWLGAAPLVRLLCLGSLALFGACLTYPVLVATGHVRDALTCSLISLPPSLAALYAASFFSVEAVAATCLLTLPFQAAVALHFVGRRLALRLRDIAAALRESAVVAACCGVAAAAGAAAIHAGWFGPALGLAFSGALIAAAGLAGLAATHHPLLSALKAAAEDRRALRRPAAPVSH
ncbi:oligosaccharide flippase family protein [Rhodoblastus acidophilus]|uniref:oligosaccharide flippase family protein n=1 Tax=Rhodoblastus acidophilus TaxID=1074 RepID=UPI0022252520|nr:oligosaccharide flippase family protein [Rhodoblastus acidophilus]